jgi:hypothetical protein
MSPARALGSCPQNHREAHGSGRTPGIGPLGGTYGNTLSSRHSPRRGPTSTSTWLKAAATTTQPHGSLHALLRHRPFPYRSNEGARSRFELRATKKVHASDRLARARNRGGCPRTPRETETMTDELVAVEEKSRSSGVFLDGANLGGHLRVLRVRVEGRPHGGGAPSSQASRPACQSVGQESVETRRNAAHDLERLEMTSESSLMCAFGLEELVFPPVGVSFRSESRADPEPEGPSASRFVKELCRRRVAGSWSLTCSPVKPHRRPSRRNGSSEALQVAD